MYKLNPLNFFINIYILTPDNYLYLNSENYFLYDVLFKVVKPKVEFKANEDWAEEIRIPGVKC